MSLNDSELSEFASAIEWALKDENRNRLSKEMAAFVSAIEERTKAIKEQNFKNRLKNSHSIELASVSSPIPYHLHGV
jgi:hypothetical protein